MSSGFISAIGTSAKSIVPLIRLSLNFANDGCALPPLFLPTTAPLVYVKLLLFVSVELI